MGNTLTMFNAFYLSILTKDQRDLCDAVTLSVIHFT